MTILVPTSKAPHFQRAQGRIKIVTKTKPNGATGLDVLRQQGSSKVIFPRPIHNNLEAVLVNTAGGVTDGDRFDVSVRATTGTVVSLTTQAAERIYGAVTDRPGLIRTKLFVEASAELCWLPQETILFDRCRLRRRLDVEVAEGGRFLMVEPIVFGRVASGEHLNSCTVFDSVAILVDEQPAYFDQIYLTGAVGAAIARPAVGAGSGAMASLVMIDENAERFLPEVRELLPETGGASVLNESTLVMRLLAVDSYALRQQLLPILDLLTNVTVPKNWRL